ncbi:hypothetical protein [Lacrimispora sp.]|uniref:hypothetical protein n=1 Tax=Lacrimispora sp. TaxID=2719234 RepID=UPI003995468A
MGSFAYINAARTIKIYAKDCTAKNKDTPFYCWNPDCKAKVNLKAANSIHKEPYFGLVSNTLKHTGWCKKITLEKTSRDYDSHGFNFNKIINNLLTEPPRTSSNTPVINSPTLGLPAPGTPPTTTITHSKPVSISDLYQICKSLMINGDFGGIKRKIMLCDDKSNFFYTKGILGYHLVECTYHHYDPLKKTIYFKYPLSSTLPNQYTVGLKFYNDKLFKKLEKFFYKCPANQIIVLAGNWKNKSGIYVTDCNSKKAIYTL